jgi:Lactate racemase N-terminal domain
MGIRLRDSNWDRHGVVERLIGDTKVPKMAVVRQKLNNESISDIPQEVRKELLQEKISSRIRPGMTVAITAGSRGIANLSLILKETVKVLKELGAKPFIFPAMGSHGGGEAEGQREVLEGLGVTEEFVGAPIKASMEVVQVDTLEDGRPVYIDKYASEADGIILVGRVKPHTCFRGEYESGMFKMLAIGVGKHQGAVACHSQGFRKMAENVPLYAQSILKNASILFGLAIIENAHDETNRMVALTPEEIPQKEPALLEEARQKMARIFFDDIDLMIVDEVGKNHSGDGMDPNITGSYSTPQASGPPNVSQYIVLNVSEESHGNAMGVGMAHFTTKRVFDQIDFDAGYPNALTARVVLGVRVPMVLKNDLLAIKAGLYVVEGNGALNPRVVRIPNSSHVGEIMISESLIEEARKNPNLEIISEPAEMDFDEAGNLF